MNIDELRKKLQKKHIPRNHYFICEKGNNDQRFCLEKKKDGWHVYFTERGVVFDDIVYETESEACEDMLQRLL